MTHEEILTLLGDYVDYLIANSSAATRCRWMSTPPDSAP